MPGGGDQCSRLSTPFGPPLAAVAAYNDEVRVYVES